MFEEGHQLTYHNLRNMSLKNWRAVLLRGEDRYQHNKLFDGKHTAAQPLQS